MGYNNLTNGNRLRHAAYMQALLDLAGLKYKLGPRLGARRSLDGLVFDIGGGKALKVIFTGRGAINNMNSIRNEYRIAKKMSDAGIGPKVYEMKEFEIPNMLNIMPEFQWPSNNHMRNIIVDFTKNKMKARTSAAKKGADSILKNTSYTRALRFNLFQNWILMNNNNYKRVRKGASIVMEKLEGAVDLYTYTQKHKFPVGEVLSLVTKMHRAGIAHGDLHLGNIMVQQKSNGTLRLIIIDFGHSVNKNNNQRIFNNLKAGNISKIIREI